MSVLDSFLNSVDRTGGTGDYRGGYRSPSAGTSGLKKAILDNLPSKRGFFTDMHNCFKRI